MFGLLFSQLLCQVRKMDMLQYLLYAFLCVNLTIFLIYLYFCLWLNASVHVDISQFLHNALCDKHVRHY